MGMTTTSSFILIFVTLPLPGASLLITPWVLIAISLPSGILITTTRVPWHDILLLFLRVGLTKIWELCTDPIAIRGSAVLDGLVCRQCKHHILNIITQWPTIEPRDIKCSCRS